MMKNIDLNQIVKKDLDKKMSNISGKGKYKDYERIGMWKLPKKGMDNKEIEKNLKPIIFVDDKKGERFYKIITFPVNVRGLDCVKILSKINKSGKITGAVVLQREDGSKKVGKFNSISIKKFDEIVETTNKQPFVNSLNAVVTDMSKCKTMDACVKKMQSKISDEGN